MAKPKDLSPKFSLKPAERELELQPGQPVMGEKVGGLSMYANAFKRGYGSKVFGSDENGIWLGAADFADAPFRVNMEGSLYAESADGSLKLDTPNNRFLVNISGVDQILLGEF
jgi:hypothetical protein